MEDKATAGEFNRQHLTSFTKIFLDSNGPIPYLKTRKLIEQCINQQKVTSEILGIAVSAWKLFVNWTKLF